MKRIISCLLAGIFLAGAAVTEAYAEESAVIYGDIAEIADSDEMLLRIYIKDNPGIMGFKLTLQYSEEELEVISASSAGICSSGMFMDNIGSREGSFDLLWNSTENAAADGEAAEILVKPLTSEPFEVEISYSQEDTFDENFEDVALVCENIVYGEKTSGEKAEPLHTEERDFAEELLSEIYALPTEQSPGEFIEEFLESRGETELTAESAAELQAAFEKEGLSESFGEELSEEELTLVYNKVLDDYRIKADIGKKGKNSGYKLPHWVIFAVPTAAFICGGVIIILHRRMRNSGKQK